MNCYKGGCFNLAYNQVNGISDNYLFSVMALLNCAHYQMIDGADVVSPLCICFCQAHHRSKLFRHPHFILEKDKIKYNIDCCTSFVS